MKYYENPTELIPAMKSLSGSDSAKRAEKTAPAEKAVSEEVKAEEKPVDGTNLTGEIPVTGIYRQV